MHDMAVSQNESIGRDHESGAAAANFARALSASPLLLDVDVDHGRRDALRDAYDCARIFVEQVRVIRGGGSRHGWRSGRGAGVMYEKTERWRLFVGECCSCNKSNSKLQA